MFCQYDSAIINNKANKRVKIPARHRYLRQDQVADDIRQYVNLYEYHDNRRGTRHNNLDRLHYYLTLGKYDDHNEGTQFFYQSDLSA